MITMLVHPKPNETYACMHMTHILHKKKEKKKDPEKVLSAKVSFMTSFGDRKRMERKGERNSGLCSREIEGMTNMLFFFFPSSLEVGMWKTVLLKEEHWDNKDTFWDVQPRIMELSIVFVAVVWWLCTVLPSRILHYSHLHRLHFSLGGQKKWWVSRNTVWAVSSNPRTVVQLPVYKGANNVPLLQHHNIDQTENSTANKCAGRLVSNQRHYTTGTANSLWA